MSGDLLLTILVITLGSLIAVRANRSLAKSTPRSRPYRYGYFLAVLAGVFAIASLWQFAADLAVGVVAIDSLVVAILTAVAARGVYARRRYGWYCVIAVLAVNTLPAAAVAILYGGGAVAALILLGVAVASIGLHLVYARRRWVEFCRPRSSLPAAAVMPRADAENTLPTDTGHTRTARHDSLNPDSSAQHPETGGYSAQPAG